MEKEIPPNLLIQWWFTFPSIWGWLYTLTILKCSPHGAGWNTHEHRVSLNRCLRSFRSFAAMTWGNNSWSWEDEETIRNSRAAKSFTTLQHVRVQSLSDSEDSILFPWGHWGFQSFLVKTGAWIPTLIPLSISGTRRHHENHHLWMSHLFFGTQPFQFLWETLIFSHVLKNELWSI